MCLAVPAKILSIKGKTANADFGGITREIDMSMMPGIHTGDFVLVHVGFAIQKIDRETAKETRGLWAEISGGNADE